MELDSLSGCCGPPKMFNGTNLGLYASRVVTLWSLHSAHTHRFWISFIRQLYRLHIEDMCRLLVEVENTFKIDNAQKKKSKTRGKQNGSLSFL